MDEENGLDAAQAEFSAALEEQARLLTLARTPHHKLNRAVFPHLEKLQALWEYVQKLDKAGRIYTEPEFRALTNLISISNNALLVALERKEEEQGKIQ